MAAQKAANVAQDTLTHTERAMVFCEGISLILPDEVATDDSVYVLNAQLRNAGKTWTQEAISRMNWIVTDRPIDGSFVFPDVGAEPPGETFIGPQSTVNLGPLLIPNKSIRITAQGRGFLYVWGWIEYDDIFRNTARHRTEFCYNIKSFVHLPDSPGGRKRSAFSISIHTKYNGADQDCMKPLQTGSKKNPLRKS